MTDQVADVANVPDGAVPGAPVTRDSDDAAARLAAKVRNNFGLNVAEVAAWLGLDRRRLTEHLEAVPFGQPASRVAAGKIPARRVGERWIVLPWDVLGVGDGLASDLRGEGVARPGRVGEQDRAEDASIRGRLARLRQGAKAQRK